MKPFITGSRAYGNPGVRVRYVDVVMFLTPDEIDLLERLADSAPIHERTGRVDPVVGSAEGPPGLICSLRFGRMNLLCVSDPAAYAVWRVGTEQLIKQRPVTRNTAVELFTKLRGDCLTPFNPSPRAFTETAIHLATAVLINNDVNAAIPLADEVVEHCSRPVGAPE